MKKHASTPWKVFKDSEGKLTIFSDEKQIAVLAFCQCTTEQEAIAALIVQAVNTHKELVKALSRAVEEQECYEGRWVGGGGWYEKATIILAKLKRK